MQIFMNTSSSSFIQVCWACKDLTHVYHVCLLICTAFCWQQFKESVSIKHCIRQSVSQSVSNSIYQSVSRSVSNPVYQSVSQSVSQEEKWMYLIRMLHDDDGCVDLDWFPGKIRAPAHHSRPPATNITCGSLIKGVWQRWKDKDSEYCIKGVLCIISE